MHKPLTHQEVKSIIEHAAKKEVSDDVVASVQGLLIAERKRAKDSKLEQDAKRWRAFRKAVIKEEDDFIDVILDYIDNDATEDDLDAAVDEAMQLAKDGDG